jgi:hypothetical protein
LRKKDVKYYSNAEKNEVRNNKIEEKEKQELKNKRKQIILRRKRERS